MAHTRRSWMAASAASGVLAQVQFSSERASKRRLLAAAVTAEKLSALLIPRAQWAPYPRMADRDQWEKLPGRDALIEAGAQSLKVDWPLLPATLFLEFARNGNRSNYEHVWRVRRNKLAALTLAECAEAKGRFLDEIANGLWLTSEETFWGFPAHMGPQKAGPGLPDAAEPIVDLFAAETASQLAWTDYLICDALDKVSPLVRSRIRLEMERRIFTPLMTRLDFGWMALNPAATGAPNNWNPWINSNWLTAALLLENDEKRRSAQAHKIIRSLDQFLDGYHDDGGCDEGPGYWFRAGASLFDCLELLHSATGGKLDYFTVPLVREIGRYVCRAHIADRYVVNFADAANRISLEGSLVYRFGRSIADEKMQAFGAWIESEAPNRVARSGESLGRALPRLFDHGIERVKPAQPFLRDVWLPGIGVMAARVRDGSREGLYLAAQGGHNAESHNHNDVGNFIVYADGRPAIIDVGVETYTAKTFSSKRYEIWTMQSAYHNLPTIGSSMQSPGREYAATEVNYKSSDAEAEFALNIERAWRPETGLNRWRRTIRLDRSKNEIEVRDRYALAKAASEITLSLMTPCRPSYGVAGELLLKPQGATRSTVVLFDARVFTPKIEEIPLSDERLRSSWGDRILRILLIAAGPPLEADWRMRFAQS